MAQPNARISRLGTNRPGHALMTGLVRKSRVLRGKIFPSPQGISAMLLGPVRVSVEIECNGTLAVHGVGAFLRRLARGFNPRNSNCSRRLSN